MIQQPRPAYFAAPGLIAGWRQPNTEYRPSMIIAQVCNYFDVPITKVLAKERHHEVVNARQIAMYFIRQMTNKTLRETGELFGSRDHTTVIHSVQTVNDLLKVDKEYRKEIEYLTKILGGSGIA